MPTYDYKQFRNPFTRECNTNGGVYPYQIDEKTVKELKAVWFNQTIKTAIKHISRPGIKTAQIEELVSLLTSQIETLNLSLVCVEKEHKETLSNKRLGELNKLLSKIHESTTWCQQSIKNLEKIING